MKAGRPWLAVVAVGILVVFVSGLSAGWFWFTPSVPPSLAVSTAPSRVPVSYQPFADTRSVTVDFALSPPVTLTSDAAGRVTSSSCSTGGTVASGSSIMAVNGEPLIALSTSIPLWRDLADGDSGKDVAALQTELSRLGYRTGVDGKVGVSTLAAIAKLLAQGTEPVKPTTIVPAGRFIWLPSETVTAGTCDVVVGETVAPGSAVATTAQQLVSVSVHELPTDLLEGARTMKLDDKTVAIAPDGRVSDAESLKALAETPSYRNYLTRMSQQTAQSSEAGSPETVNGTLSLARPVEVASVPPSAVYAVKGNFGCVSSGNQKSRVAIVGSQLGQTYVTFTGAAKPRTVDTSPGGKPTCS